MNRWQDMVHEFHAKVIGGPTAPSIPQLRDAELRARLIAEEAAETVVALVGDVRAYEILREYLCGVGDLKKTTPDIVKAVDGLCDLAYVTLGTAEAIGIDLDPHFDAVHTANMQKLGEDINDHGKRGKKPPGWVAPDSKIAQILDAQGDSALAGFEVTP